MATSTGQQFSGNNQGTAEDCSTSGNPDSVPQQLKEILRLMSSINRRLEDCAVGWQSAVSRKQWRILHTKLVSQESWEQSLLARTYFSDKSLDETFQALLILDRKFTEQLNNFVALLRGDKPTPAIATVSDAQNQCPDDPPAMDCQMDCQNESKLPAIAPLNLSSLENRVTRQTRRSKRLVGENAITTVKQSFADLIKAKINLDTKFLGFEAVLNGNTAPIEESSCLCQICSNVLGNAVNKGNMMKSISAMKQKVQKNTRPKNKRLMKSSRTWTRSKSKNDQTVSMIEIGDRAAIGDSPPTREKSAAE